MSPRHREPSSRNGRGRGLAAGVVALLATCAGGARAEDRPRAAPEPPEMPAAASASASPSPSAPEPITPRLELRHRLWLDIAVTAGATAATVTWVLVKPSIVPTSCVICESGTHVNALDDFFRTALRRRDPGPANFASDAFADGVAPVAALGLSAAAAIADRRGDEAPLDMLLVAEATAVSLALHEAAIAALRRERPDFHALSDPDVKEGARSLNAVSSFPSGHTTVAFALGASAGTIASMRGYRIAPLVWIVGMTLGAATAYFRMAADRHYFTDTLGGAALGIGTGVAVPALFHSPNRTWMQHASISTQPVEQGRGRLVMVGWGW